ncbi:hypothetical protein [Actinomarinicola tropica]|uniref:Uncharacterized protein n=1 Tax=Actinomarinicola tropica TaxID=2789776 RepID=A0A5Q2RI85_9ACTN|nr:hypothetical protein [Actinomarinicola tropica]QGG96578.1 hypothetical protein GH723_16535 [Actinomarinicola tropica]
MNHFDALDDVPVPDQWDEIVERAQADGLVDLEPDTSRRRARRVVPAVAIAAAVLAAAIAVGVVLSNDGRTDVATTQRITDGLPDLVCPDGALLDGSLPSGATPGADPLYTITPLVRGVQPGTTAWSWDVGDQTVQLNVPPVPWASEGHLTRQVHEPPGTVLYQPASTSFIAESGLGSHAGCGGYEVMVRGGTDAEEAALAVEVARSLRWEPADLASPGGPSTTESVRQSALIEAQVQLNDGSATGVAYVLEWRVGEDEPPLGLESGDTGGPGARRWAVVLIAESQSAFRALRGGPYGQPPPPVQVLIVGFGDGHLRGLSMRPLDATVERMVADVPGVPFVVADGTQAPNTSWSS